MPFGLPRVSPVPWQVHFTRTEGYRSPAAVLEADDFGEEFTPELRAQEGAPAADVERRRSTS